MVGKISQLEIPETFVCLDVMLSFMMWASVATSGGIEVGHDQRRGHRDAEHQGEQRRFETQPPYSDCAVLIVR